MPRRDDLKKILIIGSGPIVIGQACEFDYSGTQAVKALKEEGYIVVLVNSNPATIMTDPNFADRTYIEPITVDYVEEIIRIERPCAILPTMGGQTALNIAIELEEKGILEKYKCELIGAKVDAIKTAEDRDLFLQAMNEIGLESAKSKVIRSVEEAKELVDYLGFPMILRPSRTLGGTGGGTVAKLEELESKVAFALQCSPNHEVLIEESLTGWKEMELEVMRDLKDNVVIICGIENFDPMGVHTGDSITVAPIQTLTDKEYQLLRDAAIKIIRRIGVDTGGSNVQFSINPVDGRIIVIEMNPRVSRSSALASKATGFPIAKIAAKLAVGYSLDEIPNDITKMTPACFEPSIDYVVVKIPRFTFEKFPTADSTLGTQMKSVGEVMAFGGNFREAFQKAISSMELDTYGFDRDNLVKGRDLKQLITDCAVPNPDRLWLVGEALKAGASVEELFESTKIDRWFLNELKEVTDLDTALKGTSISDLDADYLLHLKKEGFTDRRLSKLLNVKEEDVRALRNKFKVKPAYKSVDTCAAEFIANTPYLYSTYETVSDAPPSKNKKVIILGSGPNRIGQGIEFDYCCVHAIFALKKIGVEAIMINCNPETVSTDYDISDRLYFEPLTLESVLEICEREKPDGVIVQFGGQTPLKLASSLAKLNIPIIGTSVESIELAEDRKMFSKLINELGLLQPNNAFASSLEEAVESAKSIGYPLMIRPSFVLGGRAMRIIASETELIKYMEESVVVSNERPVLLDCYLDNATEVDVDSVSDGEEVVVCGIMEHIERAGIHSGDSTCCLPPPNLPKIVVDRIKEKARILAKALNVIGLMNIQFAVTEDEEIYILEVNPRASRTIPFVSKATGFPWAQIATQVMLGAKLKDLDIFEVEFPSHYSVKECVFPFNKFKNVDTILGPEMKSTGEVMGIDNSFAASFAKSQIAAGTSIPKSGKVFLSVRDSDKKYLPRLAKKLLELGYDLIATSGTSKFLNGLKLKTETINKVQEGSPHIVDLLKNNEISLIINTPEGTATWLDSSCIRVTALEMKVPTFTTIAAGEAVVESMKLMADEDLTRVKAIQDYNL